MSRQSIFKVLFLSLILSSCGLIEKWKTPEQPTDSKTSAAESTAPADSGADDLFASSMNEGSKETNLKNGTDAPTNTASAAPQTEVQDDLKSLEAEFSGNTTATTAKEVASNEIKNVKVEEAIPEIKEEAPALEMKNPNAGRRMTYTVQKGDTLMQIAFKIYGDIGKWQQIKAMNQETFSKRKVLTAGLKLSYAAPDKEFVWNPEGTPYMIKNGETLGTISNSVYQTPKKWKKIWENNKPLIKNPNVIYAGFTLYYKNDGMANYVQPKAVQKKMVQAKAESDIQAHATNAIEEVKVEKALSQIEQSSSAEESTIDLTKEVQSAPIRDLSEEIKADEQLEESLSK